MLSINTNMPSLIAQRSLNNSTKLLNQAIERMTTGFKINHASDNAANYSITTNMNTKLSSYQVAEDNVAMGLDLLSTAGGSLDLISDKLTRLRALAEQSANGTYGEQSLKAINSEANAIVDEIERIYSTAEYNGINLFGEITRPTFIKPVTHRDTSSMTKLSSIDPTKEIKSGTYSISTAEELAKLADMTNHGKVSGGDFVLADNIDLSKYDNWRSIGALQGNEELPTFNSFDGNGYVISNLKTHGDEYIDDRGARITTAASLFLHAHNVKNLGLENVDCSGDNEWMLALAAGLAFTAGEIDNCYVTGVISSDSSDKQVFAAGLVAYGDGTTISNCFFNGVISATTGSEYDYVAPILAYDDSNSCTVTNCFSNVISNREFTNHDFEVKPLVDLVNNIGIQVGINSDKASTISVNTAFTLDSVSFLRYIGRANASYLPKIDEIINSVSAKQTDFGAAENRLESALEEISTQYDNLVSSRSTLRDADIAEVSSEYIRQQILQQASATLMATANQSPSLALQLL